MEVLPITTSIPAEVEDKKAYRAALGFERELLAQLSRQLTETVKGDEESGSAATQAYKDMLPEALADSMVAAGGTGIALNLYRSIHQADAPASEEGRS
jgi:Rod binding domain-containing protein